MTPLGRLSPRAFLRNYWQKKPLFIRGGYPLVKGLLSKEELAGLACEEHIGSRLVLESLGAKPWELRRGPFSPKDFHRLPPKGWSLLVHGLERRLPEIAALLKDFAFIPRWRLDDIMVSYAPDGGSVGPHVDDYDVFLIQAEGQRQWQISEKPLADDFVPGLDLKILRRFKSEKTYLAQPGDVLYLPPRFGHHGVAVGEAMTFSIGFRAPSGREIITALAETLNDEGAAALRYSDPGISLPRDSHAMDSKTLERARTILNNLIADDKALMEALGRWGTQSHDQAAFQPLSRKISEATLWQRLQRGTQLVRGEGLRLSYTTVKPARLFVEGETYTVTKELQPLVQILCRKERLKFTELKSWRANSQAAALLCALVNAGYWELKSTR